jgi:hypothetical protein
MNGRGKREMKSEGALCFSPHLLGWAREEMAHLSGVGGGVHVQRDGV